MSQTAFPRTALVALALVGAPMGAVARVISRIKRELYEDSSLGMKTNSRSTSVVAMSGTLVLAALLRRGTADAMPTFGAGFTGLYTITDLGTLSGIPGPFGGLTFLDNDTIIMGGRANQTAADIHAFNVSRDGSGHINGFTSAGTFYADSPEIDGGLSFGPGGVLFYTGYNENLLGQIKPGFTAPSRLDSLSPTISGSVVALAFVPSGFAGAGQLKVVSYSSGQWTTVTLSPDGFGTYNFSVATPTITLGGGPEGIAYVKAVNPGFLVDSILLAEWGVGKVATYAIDANDDPIVSSRRDFINGLSGAEGAVIDPVTGDFLFSDWGGGDHIWRVSGFTPPPSTSAPAPGALSLMLLGLASLFAAAHKKIRRSNMWTAGEFASAPQAMVRGREAA